MSKLVVVNYRLSDAQARETMRKIALIRAILERCVKLQKELSSVEAKTGEDWAETLQRFRKAADSNRWNDFVGDYNRLYDDLPGVERQLEKVLADAKAKRLRLELTASTLLASCADGQERRQLEAIAKKARGLHGSQYKNVMSEVEAIVRRRLSTPLEVKESGLEAGQVALARELLAAVPKDISPLPLPETWSSATKTEATSHADRVKRLSEQLSEIDPEFAPVDDLIARLQEVAAKDAGECSLLIDSIELEAKERLVLGRTRRDVERTLQEGLAWLAPFASADAEAHRRQLNDAAALSPEAVRKAAASAKAWAEAEGARADGARVREALLAELRGLGYEVNVQGEWQEGSRVTIHKPSEPNYDVQLSAPPNGSVQSKVRAYDHAGRSTGVNRRDVEMEQSWCDDLARVNKSLAAKGVAADVLHEEGPGASAQLPLPARQERVYEVATVKELERKL